MMALKISYTTHHGIVIPEAYVRVESIRFIGKSQIDFSGCIYYDPLKSVLESRQMFCAYDIAGDNPIAQAYTHLKTLPEFADAVDC